MIILTRLCPESSVIFSLREHSKRWTSICIAPRWYQAFQYLLLFRCPTICVSVLFLISPGGHWVYGPVQSPSACVWCGASGEDHRRLPGPVLVVWGWQAQTFPTLDQTCWHRATSTTGIQMVSRWVINAAFRCWTWSKASVGHMIMLTLSRNFKWLVNFFFSRNQQPARCVGDHRGRV